MARQKRVVEKKETNYIPKVQTITQDDVTVNIHHEASSNRKVTILFLSRGNQSFQLPNGKEVTIVGNGVYLANPRGGALPAGGYGVTVLDKDDWEAVKRAFPKWIGRWLDGGILIEKASEASGLNFAQDNAGDETDYDPIDPKKTRTQEAPNPNFD